MAPIYSDEIRLLVPAGDPFFMKKSITCRDLVGRPLLLPKTGVTRTQLNAWFEPEFQEQIVERIRVAAQSLGRRFRIGPKGFGILAGNE